MAMLIADTATVDPRAELADEVEVGPYCVIGPEVRIGRGTRLIAHVCLMGPTRLGERNLLSPFTTIGAEHGESEGGGRVEIGDGNTIREGSSIEAGSCPDRSTRIGSGSRLGPHVTVGRDAWVGDEVQIGSGVRLGALAAVESFAQITAGVDVHPAATIGEFGFAGGPTRIFQDVPRYMLADGSPSRVRSINHIGLRRRGVSRSAIRALREAHRLLFRARLDPKDAALRLVDHGLMTPEVIRLLESVHAQRAGRHGRARDAGRRDGERRVA